MTTAGPQAGAPPAPVPRASRPLTAAVGSPAVRTGLAPIPRRRRRPRPAPIVERLVDQIEAGPGDVPSEGGWSGGFANQAHWDPSRARDWRCWAQSGPTWSAHCGAEVAADDTLGLCQRHRRSLLEGDAEADLSAPPAERLPAAPAERVLSTG